MTASAQTRIVFTAGRYNTDQTMWCEATNAPSASIEERLFRSIFDAAGEQTIDTHGDIDPGVMLGLVELGPTGCKEAVARLRLLGRWAQCRGMRVHFEVELLEEAEVAVRNV